MICSVNTPGQQKYYQSSIITHLPPLLTLANDEKKLTILHSYTLKYDICKPQFVLCIVRIYLPWSLPLQPQQNYYKLSKCRDGQVKKYRNNVGMGVPIPTLSNIPKLHPYIILFPHVMSSVTVI